MLNGKLDNIFEPEVYTVNGYTNEIIELKQRFNECLEKRIFIWLKEGYNYVYGKMMIQGEFKDSYGAKMYYFPTHDKMEIESEINLKDFKDKLIVEGIDYKNKTFEEFKALVLWQLY